MTGYRLSRLAELDLDEIADYTMDAWGANQADIYINQLVECFLRIAQRPELGRPVDSVHPGFRRIEQGKHVIFYMTDSDGAFISRILHQSMLPSRHRIFLEEP